MKLEHIITPPKDFSWDDPTMSNFDGSIDLGMEDHLRGGGIGQHCAWEFHASVWHDGQSFVSQVKRYCSPQASYRADTLEDLMRQHNEDWGNE